MKQLITLLTILFIADSQLSAQATWTVSGTNIYNPNTGNVGIGTTTPTNKLSVLNAAQLSGMTSTISTTQTQVNTGDLGDGAFSASYTLSKSSTSNQFVTRVFQLGSVNNLTGGGAVSYMRVLNVANNTNAGTTTGDLDAIFIENGTTAGVVNNSRAIRVNNFQGTNQAGLAVNTMGGTNHTYALLGTISIPVGNYGVYASGSADKNYFAGNTGIGTTNPQAKLDVNGNIFCNSKVYIGTADAATTTQIANYALAVNGTAIFNTAKVKLYGNWPDYVFDDQYKLMSLQEVENFLKLNKHLPGVPAATEVEKDGIDLGANQSVLLKKVEELTLYMIDQNKKISAQQDEINNLKNQLMVLQKR